MKPLPVCVLVALSASCIKTDKERAITAGATPLTREEAAEVLSGNTLTGVIPQYNIRFVSFYSPDGRIVGAISGPVTDRARGTWRITEDGQVCNEWDKETWRSGTTCNTFYRDGDELKVFLPEGGIASKAEVKLGNAAKLELRSDYEVAVSSGSIERVPADFLRERVPGNTVSGKLTGLGNATYHAFYGSDGTISGFIPTASERDVGSYRITEEGEVCVTWRRWLEGDEHCGPWFRDGESIRVFDASGNLALTVGLRTGDPESLRAE